MILKALIELGGGAAIVLGWRTRSVALLILLFAMLFTRVFHRCWAVPFNEAMVQ